jgi:hypothetical protein
VPQVLESFILGKTGNAAECEDGIFVNGNFLAVVDGVTSKGKHLFNGMKSGCAAKNAVLGALETLEASVSSAASLDLLNDAIMGAYGDFLEIARADVGERMAVCIALYSVKRRELWCFGDCQCMINGELHRHEKEFDAIVSAVRALAIETALAGGADEKSLFDRDIGREFIMPLLEKEAIFVNRPGRFGFDMLDGISRPLYERIKTYRLSPGDEVILASDGYPELCRTLEQSEAQLERVLKEDPLCYIENISTKGVKSGNISFDDRSYLKFIVD